MFRKIVSNLSFSPALVGQLGFYAKRLRKEEVTRRLGLIFTALALVVQALVVFQPAESANAANSNDFVAGGLGSSLDNFIRPYDSNSRHLKDILNNFGITREELVAARYTSWKADNKLSWGFEPRFSYAQGERKVNIVSSEGTVVTSIYGRPMSLWGYGTKSILGWVGHSKKIGWFAITRACGNLVTEVLPPPPEPKKCVYNANILATDEECRPCPGKDTLWINDEDCKADIELSKTAVNISKSSVDATATIAAASNIIKYSLTVSNTGLASAEVDIKENLKDVSEYARVIDDGGGRYNSNTKTLTWPSVTLSPGEKQTRVFTVKVLDKIPATAKGESDPTSFNCVMTNVFGNQVDIKVQCPTEKVVENVVKELPTTGPTENMIFAGLVLSIVTYFYARTRQLKTEIRLIRHNLNTGTI